MSGTENQAPYACDRCYRRKIPCSKTLSGCTKCTEDVNICTYSRTGVIRRNKRKYDEPPNDAGRLASRNTAHTSGLNEVLGNPDTSEANLQSQMATDIEITRQRLSKSSGLQTSSLGALSSLSEAYTAVWHDGSDFDRAGKHYFLFEDLSQTWVQVFVTTLARGRPLVQPAPAAVLDHLRAAQPERILDRAWLVMFYSIILSFVSSTEPENESTKAKLRCNLWLALNDVRLLLEPSEANVQALALLASHVEEFTTPVLSWILITNACRMLQALGVSYRRLDPETRERRRMTFWYLNIIDKGLALIFGRPPSFHQAMTRDIPMPTLQDLYSFQPHSDNTRVPSLFGSHFLQQTMQLSDVIGEIWNCLHGHGLPDDRSIGATIGRLDGWYKQSREVLEAAATAEKPFLDAKGSASIDLGLVNRQFQYCWLSLLLKQSSPRYRSQCLKLSKEMLRSLEKMVSDSEEPYNGIIWHMVCSPFTPFFNLFGEILSNGKGDSKVNKEALAAMELLPVFLMKMSVHNRLAAKLERIATVLVKHTRSVVYPENNQTYSAMADSGLSLPDSLPHGNMLDWEYFFNFAMTAPSDFAQTTSRESDQEDLNEWTNSFMEEAFVDWLGGDGQIL